MTVMNIMLGKGRGGLETVAYQYARVFKERGHESIMMCNRRSPLSTADGVVRIATCTSSMFNLLNYLRIVWAVRKYRCEVVFCHGGRAARFCNFLRRFLPRTTRVIGISHGTHTKSFRDMDCVIAVSESVQHRLVHEWDAPEGRIKVVHNAVCVPPARERPQSPVPTIGFIGRLHECKAVDVLIEACAAIKERGVDFKLLLAGDGPEREALHALAEKCGVAERIEWLGWVDAAKKEEFFDRIDILAMPSRQEAFGMVMLEAMARGKPVVVSDCEVPAKIVTEARCGRVVPRNDENALADALAGLIGNRAELRDLGERAVAAVNAKFSEKILGDELEDVISNCDVTTKRSLTPGRFRVLALMLADLFCLTVTWVVLVCSYKALGFGTYHAHYYWQLWPIAPMFVGFNMIIRLYHGSWMYPAMPLSPVEEFRRLLASSLFAHLLLMSFLGFARHNLDYSRFIIGFSGVVVGFLAQSVRNLVRIVLFKLKICQIPVALAGTEATAKRVEAILKDSPYIGFDIVLKFDEKHLKEIVPKSQRLDVKILLACQDERLFRAQLRDFAGWFNYIEYLPRMEVFPVFGSHAVSVDSIGGIEMMNQNRMKALRWEKHTLDIILSIIASVLTLPLFIIIPILIKLTSKGPVFYRQERLGKMGRPFRIWKFRTMYDDADARLQSILAADPALKAEYEANFKLKHDPRITTLGRFLRKTSLDEIPQLFNVFAGEMSFIGPRPIVAAEVHYYGNDYEVFSRIRPGVTGLWQCSGRSDTDYATRVALDVYYALNWSPWMDLWICIRTVFSVLCMRGSL